MEMNFQVIVVLEEVVDSVWVAEVTIQGEVMVLVEVNWQEEEMIQVEARLVVD